VENKFFVSRNASYFSEKSEGRPNSRRSLQPSNSSKYFKFYFPLILKTFCPSWVLTRANIAQRSICVVKWWQYYCPCTYMNCNCAIAVCRAVLWIRIRIRILSDPKLLAGSGTEKIIPDPGSSGSGQLRIRN
jgi:hypothetical protein